MNCTCNALNPPSEWKELSCRQGGQGLRSWMKWKTMLPKILITLRETQAEKERNVDSILFVIWWLLSELTTCTLSIPPVSIPRSRCLSYNARKEMRITSHFVTLIISRTESVTTETIKICSKEIFPNWDRGLMTMFIVSRESEHVLNKPLHYVDNIIHWLNTF